MFCHPSCLCAAVGAGNCRQKPLCVKMASVIETEFRIRTPQAPLGERRNKDRLGHIVCNLRLIIVPGGTYKGRGDVRGSPLPLLTHALPRSLPEEAGSPAGTQPHSRSLGVALVAAALPAPGSSCMLAARRRGLLPEAAAKWMPKFCFCGQDEGL